MFGLGIWEIVLLLAVVLLIFGPSRLPGLGKSIGASIRGFKKGLNDDEVDVTERRKLEDDQNKKS